MATHVLASHSEGPLSIVWQAEPPGVLADNIFMISN
jgi:hypothetical protein